MTYKELLSYNKGEIRSNSTLTFFFISAYKSVFGIVPSCAGCSINSEFANLVKEIKKQGIEENIIEENQNISKMENKNKTFVFASNFNEPMIAYVKNGRVYRKHTNKVTDEFAREYLANGTDAEIELRRKNFKVLPKDLDEVKEVEESKEEKTESVEATEVETKPKRRKKKQ